jgi:hypothetical protein
MTRRSDQVVNDPERKPVGKEIGLESQSPILEGCAADNPLPSIGPHLIIIPSERARSR